jgi:hypothetical protein
MKGSCVSLALAALFSATSMPAVAQVVGPLGASGMAVGVTGALSSNFHEGGFGRFYQAGTADCDCPQFNDGTGDGYQVGVAFRYQLLQIIALDARAVFDSRPAHFEEQLPEAQVIEPGGGPNVLTQTVVAKSDVVYQTATFEVLATARLAINDIIALSASIGPGFGFVTTGTITQSQELVSPSNARFENPQGFESENEGRRLVFVRDIDIPERSAMRTSVKVGGAVELGPIASVLVRGGVYYDRGLTGVRTTGDWKISSMLYQLDLMFVL